MAKKKSRKYFYSYTAGSFITSFCLFGIVGAFVAFFFFPVFRVEKGAELLLFNGLDYVGLGLGDFIRMVIPTFPAKDISLLSNYFDGYSGSNVLLDFIAKYYSVVHMVLSGLFVITLVFVVIEAILAIFWLLRGRIQFPRVSTALAWTAFAFFALDIGLLFAYIYFSSQIIKSASDPGIIQIELHPFFILGAVFILSIIISVIYTVNYRDRRHKKRERKDDDGDGGDNNDQNTNNQQQANPAPTEKNLDVDQEEPEPEMEMPEQDIPEGLSEIADHAFSKDKSLTRATIAHGVEILGGGAFANCHNLRAVYIPSSVTEICYNCFFNTPRLTNICYAGTKDQWSRIKRGSNWLTSSGTTTVTTLDGVITVDPRK